MTYCLPPKTKVQSSRRRPRQQPLLGEDGRASREGLDAERPFREELAEGADGRIPAGKETGRRRFIPPGGTSSRHIPGISRPHSIGVDHIYGHVRHGYATPGRNVAGAGWPPASAGAFYPTSQDCVQTGHLHVCRSIWLLC